MKRASGELARSLADYTLDFLTGTLAAMVALGVIFASASLPVGGLWMSSAAMVIGGGTLLARSKFVSQPRLLAVTTGCLAAGTGALLLLVVLLAVNLLE